LGIQTKTPLIKTGYYNIFCTQLPKMIQQSFQKLGTILENNYSQHKIIYQTIAVIKSYFPNKYKYFQK